MKFQPSFFNFAGFFLPGLLFLSLYSLVDLYFGDIGYIKSSISGQGFSNINFAFISVQLFVLSYFLGSLFSLIFMWLNKSFKNKYYKIDNIIETLIIDSLGEENIATLQKDSMLFELLSTKNRFMEIYAYSDPGSVDIYAIAGRVRMMGASSISLFLLSFVLYTTFSISICIALIIIIFSLCVFLLATNESRAHDEYACKLSIVQYLKTLNDSAKPT